ncbi:hypothetical protein ACO1O0_004691 [Amphichorda felina]
MADSEDSPEALGSYRAYCNKGVGRALNFQGDWELTEKSQAAEAVWIAALNWHSEDVDTFQILFDIRVGDYSKEDWDTLQAKLKQLM